MVDNIPSTATFEVWEEGKVGSHRSVESRWCNQSLTQWFIQWFIDTATWPERNNHLQSFWGGHFVSPHVLACVSRPICLSSMLAFLQTPWTSSVGDTYFEWQLDNTVWIFWTAAVGRHRIACWKCSRWKRSRSHRGLWTHFCWHFCRFQTRVYFSVSCQTSIGR